MKYEFDTLVFLGRFAPFHDGHRAVVDRALNMAKRLVVLVGSADAPVSHRTPFTTQDRIAMIRESTRNHENRIEVIGVADHPYDNVKWVSAVQAAVASANPGEKVGIIGHDKDESSYYLRMFPQWEFIDVPSSGDVSGTAIREAFFSPNGPGAAYFHVPQPVANFLRAYRATPEFKQVFEEDEFVRDYRKQWASTPYPVIFQTVDAVVVQGGHVLLVKRGAHPGKGRGALPGGYVNRYETLEAAAIRELREETRIDVPDGILRSNIVADGVFDDPWRDPRGRVITHAFLIDLDGELESRSKRRGAHQGLAKIKGSDDAEKAKWVPISQLDPKKMFSDHHAIVMKLLGKMKS